MKNLFCVVIIVGVVVTLLSGSVQAVCSPPTCCFDRPGVYSTPGFDGPDGYPHNLDERCQVTAPQDHVVRFDFINFDTDYEDELELLETFRGDEERTYFGKNLGTFTHISKTNFVKFFFPTDHQFKQRGFKAYISFMDARVYCNATYLKSLYDDASSTCHNETDYLATSCDISWRKNNITKTCENGEWKTTSASLDEVEVQLCDDPTSTCPFMEDDLSYFYYSSSAFPPLTEEETQQINMGFNSTSSGRFRRSPLGCSSFCDTKRDGGWVKDCEEYINRSKAARRRGRPRLAKYLYRRGINCFKCQQLRCRGTSVFTSRKQQNQN